MTQEELAERAAISVETISALERGIRRSPYRATVASLADALELRGEVRTHFVAVGRGTGGADGRQEIRSPIGGYLGAAPPGPLVGREAEMRRLLALIDAVAGGTGRLVLLAGEAGVGKTRLAQEVTLAVQSRGFLAACGRCYAPQQTVPYYPFLDALATAYGAAPGSVRTEARRRWPYLARLLPDQLGPLGAAPSDGPEEQLRLFRAVTGFLVAIAAELPVALLLDDLHWADTASLDLLQHLARHTGAHRVLVLGTHRDERVEYQPSLDQALHDLTREQLLERMAVERLGQDGVAALIVASFGAIGSSQELAGLVYRQTEGNPFFTQEVLRALVERGDVYHDTHGWSRREITEIEVPQSVRSAIRERVSRLSASAQALLHEASVLGQTFAFDDLQAMDDHPEDDVESALEEGESAGLVRETGRESYGFNHTLTQQALYTDLSTRRRAKLHRAAAMVLEQLPESVRVRRSVELARHFLEGRDPQRALPYVFRAGDQAEFVFAHHEAEWQYRSALELARRIEDVSRVAEALDKLSKVLYFTSQYDEQLLVLDEAAQLYQKMRDLEGEARVTALIGWGYYERHNSRDEGIARIRAVLQRASDRPASPGLFALYETLASLCVVSEKFEEAQEAAERCAALARVLSDTRLIARAEGRRGRILRDLGRYEQALQALEAVIPLAEEMNDLDTLARALDNAARVYEAMGDLDRFRSYNERNLVLAKQMERPLWIVHTTWCLGHSHWYAGNLGQAGQYFEEAAHIVRGMGTFQYSSILALVGFWRWLQGDAQSARSDLEECVVLAERLGASTLLCDAHGFLAEIDLQEGRAAAARARLEPLVDRPTLDSWGRLSLRRPLARAYLALGSVVEAQEVLANGLAWVRMINHRILIVETLPIQGMIMARQQKWDDATTLFEEALSIARSLPYPYGEARALLDFGVTHLWHGDGQEAQEQLERALVIFRRLGVLTYAEQTRQALALLVR
jgi:tetratricopeptide (TPR) repeat protein